MARRLRAALVAAFVTLAFDCGTSPSGPSLAGTWVGTEIDTTAGVGNLQAIVTQSGSNLSGTYSLTFSNPIFSNNGTLSGTINGTNVTMTATPSVNTICAAVDTATVNSAGTQINGTYAAVSGCALPHQTGSFSASKQ